VCGAATAQDSPDGLKPLYEVKRTYALPAEWGRELNVEAKHASIRVLTGAPGLLDCEFLVADPDHPPVISRVEGEDRSWMEVTLPYAFAVSDDEQWTIRIDPDVAVIGVWTDTGNVDVVLSGEEDLGVFVGTGNGHVSLDLAELRAGEVDAAGITTKGNLLVCVPSDASVGLFFEEDPESINAPGFTRTDDNWSYEPADTALSIGIMCRVSNGEVNVVLVDRKE
jgi:hypothetical protein